MNAGKRDRPYQYSEPFIVWMACIHAFLQMPYHQMGGVIRKLATFIHSLRAADYTTLFRRIQRRDLSLTVTPEFLAKDIIIAVDPGFPVTHNEPDQSAMFFSSKSSSLFKIKAIGLFLVMYNT